MLSSDYLTPFLPIVNFSTVFLLTHEMNRLAFDLSVVTADMVDTAEVLDWRSFPAMAEATEAGGKTVFVFLHSGQIMLCHWPLTALFDHLLNLIRKTSSGRCCAVFEMTAHHSAQKCSVVRLETQTGLCMFFRQSIFLSLANAGSKAET